MEWSVGCHYIEEVIPVVKSCIEHVFRKFVGEDPHTVRKER